MIDPFYMQRVIIGFLFIMWSGTIALMENQRRLKRKYWVMNAPIEEVLGY